MWPNSSAPVRSVNPSTTSRASGMTGRCVPYGPSASAPLVMTNASGFRRIRSTIHCASGSRYILGTNIAIRPPPKERDRCSVGRRHGLPQARWAHVGPVLLDVLQTFSPGRLTEDHLPAGGHLGEHWPEGVLILVVDNDVEATVLIIEWVRAQLPPSFTVTETVIKTPRIGPVTAHPAHSPIGGVLSTGHPQDPPRPWRAEATIGLDR
jgi:hypothetical protein